jgi:hypothetical protein
MVARKQMRKIVGGGEKRERERERKRESKVLTSPSNTYPLMSRKLSPPPNSAINWHH